MNFHGIPSVCVVMSYEGHLCVMMMDSGSLLHRKHETRTDTIVQRTDARLGKLHTSRVFTSEKNLSPCGDGDVCDDVIMTS